MSLAGATDQVSRIRAITSVWLTWPTITEVPLELVRMVHAAIPDFTMGEVAAARMLSNVVSYFAALLGVEPIALFRTLVETGTLGIDAVASR
jgi:hypothetical protein